jgi:hypothetical protein
MKDQASQILEYMRRGRSIDPMVALRLFGSFRLAARIKDLKDDGHRITREMIETREGKKIARYSLAA